MPSDAQTWMWARAQALLEEAARIQRQFLVRVGTAEVPSWTPPVDVFETPTELWVVAALPGVDLERAEIVIDESGALLIRARRDIPVNLTQARFLRLEIPFGYFERRVQLPSGRYRLIESVLADGLLRLRLLREGSR